MPCWYVNKQMFSKLFLTKICCFSSILLVFTLIPSLGDTNTINVFNKADMKGQVIAKLSTNNVSQYMEIKSLSNHWYKIGNPSKDIIGWVHLTPKNPNQKPLIQVLSKNYLALH